MSDAEPRYEQAVALHRAGRHAEALAAYDAALAVDPRHAGALHLSALLSFQLGRLPDAIVRIERSLAADPNVADAWSNAGLIYGAAARRDDAGRALERAVAIEPELAEVWQNLSSHRLEVDDVAGAEAAARRAVELDALPGGYFNLALAFAAQGRHAEALQALDEFAATVGSQSPDPALPGLRAQQLIALGRRDEARAVLDGALAAGDDAVLRLERARLAETQGDLVVSETDYRALLRPNFGDDALRDIAFSELVFQKKQLVAWDGLATLQATFRERALSRARAGAPSSLTPFSFLSDRSTRAEQRAVAEAYARRYASTRAAPRTLSTGRLRVGYLSADLHEHATGVLAVGLFEHHDRGRFEICAYSTGPDDGSALRRRLVAAFDRFVDAHGWSDARLAQRIADDGIDILVDLKGHTEHAPTGVMALRPAPIAVSYLGYPGTMGAPFVDYVIGDRIVTPLAHADDYAETIVQLPASYQVNDDRRAIAEPIGRAALGLPEDAVVLCCFNSAYKINPEVVDAWAAILAAVDDAVLWLLVPTVDRGVAARLTRELGARGVAPGRALFAHARPHAEYLALYRHADLFLDTWPYNAHTTASDALWAGCPIVTIAGDTFAGRVAASLLTAFGVTNGIAPDRATYVATAIAWARDRPRLKAMRELVEARAASAPLFDTAATTRAIEAAYGAMATQYRGGRRAPILVSADGTVAA